MIQPVTLTAAEVELLVGILQRRDAKMRADNDPCAGWAPAHSAADWVQMALLRAGVEGVPPVFEQETSGRPA